MTQNSTSGWHKKIATNNLEHGEWTDNPLQKSQIITQCMVCNRFRHNDGTWTDLNPNPGAPVSHSICPQDYETQMEILKARNPNAPIQPYPQAKVADADTPEAGPKPATYSEDDPLDIEPVKQMVDDLHSEWWKEPPEVQRQAIANGFRAALVSPRQNLKWNSIVYQDMQDIPAHESDPDVFEKTIRDKKEKWDRFGQQTIDLVNQQSDPEWIDYGNQVVTRYMPGIWGNVRNASLIGPHIEELRKAALDDIAQGGDGRLFRQRLLDMNIPGIGPKIAAFVWLLLCPKTSRIAAIDVHMMRHLGQPVESPKDYNAYLDFERQLDDQRKAMGYTDVPLGAFQWALWDRQRTPGFHQDHTPLRPLKPVDWRKVDWAPAPVSRKKQVEQPDPEQQQLFSRWKSRRQ